MNACAIDRAADSRVVSTGGALTRVRDTETGRVELELELELEPVRRGAVVAVVDDTDTPILPRARGALDTAGSAVD